MTSPQALAALRQARWRSAHPAENRERRNDCMRKLRAEGREKPRGPRNVNHPFIALDGEGCGYDDLGRQYYQLLRASDATGVFNKRLADTSNNRITTRSALEFILSMPKNATLVGFFFGYDVTMILHDLPAHRKEDLFGDKSERRNRYTYWENYGIEYQPKQYFRVCRIDRNSLKVIPNSSRTINEVGTFFQKSFVEALRDWGFAESHPGIFEMIAENKQRRSQFAEIGPREDSYCKWECALLAQLMEKFRATCRECGIVPRHWRGAGHIAARLHELHKTPLKKDRKTLKVFEDFCKGGFYGGRFEVTSIGRIKGNVFEYDINSAYPAAMLALPCPVHSRWQKFRGDDIPNGTDYYIADLRFEHPATQFLCGFPIRQKGRLFFPRKGSGIYWSPEIEAARRSGAKVKLAGGYAYRRTCNCCPFTWVEELYNERKRRGKQTIGYPIKLGINGLYGKLAQRIGAAPWRDYLSAGLITSITRAKIIDAYSQDPTAVLYIATDAIYSRRPLSLEAGDGLGLWESKQRDGIFIVQPGIYWSGDAKPKTRGIPRSIVIENRAAFEGAWNKWIDGGAAGDPPIVPVFVNQFIGLRAAIARGKPELAGTWLADLRELCAPLSTPGDPYSQIGIRNIDFDWHLKRKPYGNAIIGEEMMTLPFRGNRYLRSEAYDGSALTDFDAQLIEREDDPDYEPWGASNHD